ncbi:LysE/ArgO family amino acid transporter [Nesterenkonia sphaerica]|uniref:Amino acid transporter n=1 Tax=Nesterenkonia sphaerica TaxID=1804988 RepID=A0A5R9AQ67_9MICC|nr:LysE family transporter [Nesterenkonia sphaerica]TLP79996.1 amino acid transporter [Nesterenkonia sphaerica]
MLTVLLTGLLTTLALIVAIGPQSAWLLRQGLRRDRVALAALCCLLGDIVLIVAGTAGVGVVLDHAPWLLDAIRWVGVGYLTWFAYRSFRSAYKSRSGSEEGQSTAESQASGIHFPGGGGEVLPERSSREEVRVAMTSELPVVPEAAASGDTATKTRRKVRVTKVSKVSTVAATGLMLSVLNPHAWVDSLVVLGTMANAFGPDKWWFAAGAVLASVLWLNLLAGGSAVLAKLLSSPRTWKVIDVAVGVMMLVVAGVLAFTGF